MDDTTGRMTDADQRAAEADADDFNDDFADADVARRTAQVRNEIEETREEMAETIDAIQEKLRPRNIVASATESVKEATTERIRAMTDTAGEAAQNAMYRTRETAGSLMDTIRENPYPAALIGVGVAWMMMSSSRSSGRSYEENDGWDQSGPYEPSRAYGGSAYRYRDRGVRGQISDSTEEWVDRGREYAQETSRTIRQARRRVQGQFGRMMSQNPLLVGAGALLVGAAFGLAVPETDTENAWMGEARDSVVDRAQEFVGDAAQKLQDTAKNVADTAGSVADSVNRS